MVRTTVELDEDIYKKLVEESIEKYGTARHISKLINQKLRTIETGRKDKMIKLPSIKLGKKIDWKFVEKVVEKEATKIWKE